MLYIFCIICIELKKKKNKSTGTNWLSKVRKWLFFITNHRWCRCCRGWWRVSPWIISEQIWHKSQHNSSAEGWQRSVSGVKPSRGTRNSELWTNGSTHPLAPRPLPHSIFWHQILDLLYTFYVSPQVFQILLREGGLVFLLSSNLSAWVHSICPQNTEADSMPCTALVEKIKYIAFNHYFKWPLWTKITPDFFSPWILRLRVIQYLVIIN